MKQFLVKPGSNVKLSEWDPNNTGEFKGGKKEGLAKLEKLNDKLESLQELLYAEHKHKVLVVLQAMDTGGKDGVIRRVFDGVNPRVAIDRSVVIINREITRKMEEFGYLENGVKVKEFKIPTIETVKKWMEDGK